MKKSINGKLKLVFNKETIASLQDSAMQAIKGGARSWGGEDGAHSCVNKATICDCPETDGCPTFTCNYTMIYIGTRCW